jgi:hypothetical protein
MRNKVVMNQLIPFYKPNIKSEEWEDDDPPHSSNQTHPYITAPKLPNTITCKYGATWCLRYNDTQLKYTPCSWPINSRGSYLSFVFLWHVHSQFCTVDVTRDSHSAWTSFYTNICCMNITVRASSGLHAEERLLRTCDPARTDLPPHTWIELQKSLFWRNFLICSIMIGAFWIINLLHWFGEVARFRNNYNALLH